MTVLNNMLNEMAKAAANDSYVVPSYLAFGSDTLTISVSDSSITGEIGSRSATTDSVATATVTFNALRSGATAASGGDTLNAAYLVSASTGGTLLSEVILPSLLHTTNFDIDADWSFTFQRVGGA